MPYEMSHMTTTDGKALPSHMVAFFLIVCVGNNQRKFEKSTKIRKLYPKRCRYIRILSLFSHNVQLKMLLLDRCERAAWLGAVEALSLPSGLIYFIFISWRKNNYRYIHLFSGIYNENSGRTKENSSTQSHRSGIHIYV